MEQLISIETVPISVEYVEKKPSQTSIQLAERLQAAKQDEISANNTNLNLVKADSFQSNIGSEDDVLTYSASAQHSSSTKPSSTIKLDSPPVLELKVLERPRVIIKYVGGPIYIPKSSDPDYVAPENNDLFFDGKCNFDAKA